MSNDKTLDNPLDNYMQLMATLKNPAYRIPVSLNIKAFKRFLKGHPELTKAQRNSLVKQYKVKGWTEYDTIVKFQGNFPTRSVQKKEEDSGK